MSTPSVPGHPQPQLDPHSDLPAAATAATARRKRMNLIAFILATAIVSLLLRLTYYTGKETKALMFVGIPTALALLLVLTPSAKSTVGIAAKGVTIGLLMSAILFGEGMICILMTAPIAYIVAISVAFAISSSRPKGPLVMCLHAAGYGPGDP